ncbi:MAG: hypothetical protein FWF54_10340 [Candidatus Azobacteroides sp.]|nr:hypothetical protein [Candidatus Azobacteroides sp.]
MHKLQYLFQFIEIHAREGYTYNRISQAFVDGDSRKTEYLYDKNRWRKNDRGNPRIYGAAGIR